VEYLLSALNFSYSKCFAFDSSGLFTKHTSFVRVYQLVAEVVLRRIAFACQQDMRSYSQGIERQRTQRSMWNKRSTGVYNS
jgi:hypothetical protein